MGERLYQGCLKSFSPKDGYGFIACPALKVTFGRDVYIHRSKVPDRASAGCALQFTIGLNAKGQPQAQVVTLLRGAAALGGQTMEDPAPAAPFVRTDFLRFEPAQLPEESSSRPLGEYAVVLTKKPGQRLGVDVDDDSLLIDKVTGGAVADWNQTRPHMPVQPGDRIVQVNNVRGNVRAVLEECKRAQHLEIRLSRPTQAASSSGPTADPRSPAGPETGVLPSLRILSWNILAGAYASAAAFPDVDPKVLPAKRRRAQVAAALAQLAGDVICLQEVDCPLEELGLPDKDFDSVHAQRPDGRCDRCVIAWRRDRLEMGPAGWIEIRFDDHPPPAFHRSPSDYASGDVGLAVELQFRKDAGRRCITICTTHLCWQPHKADVQKWQLHTLDDEAKNLGGRQAKNKRVVICGDMNATPGSDPVKYISTACRLQSAYVDVESTAVTTSSAGATAWDGPFSAMIDYVWYTPKWLTLLSRIHLPSGADLKAAAAAAGGASAAPDGSVPTLLSPTWPSNHLMIGAVLLLTNPDVAVDVDAEWD